MLAQRNVTSAAVQNWENEWCCWSTARIFSVYVTCLGKQDYWSLSAKSKLNPDWAPRNAAKSKGVALNLWRVETCSWVFFRSTFVGSLHVLFFKHQVVALHCSRVELQPENNFTLRRNVTLVITFNLKEKFKKYVDCYNKYWNSEKSSCLFLLPWCPLLEAVQAPAWCIHGLCGLDQCDWRQKERSQAKWARDQKPS